MMRYRFFPLLVFLCFFLSFVHMAPCVSAEHATLSPEFLRVVGDPGEFIMETVMFSNNENSEMDLTISIDNISNVWISDNKRTVEPNESLSIMIGFNMKEDQIGWITYDFTWENGSKSGRRMQLFQMVVNETQVDMFTYPASPEQGGTVTFLLIDHGDIFGRGMIFVGNTGNIHTFNISFGMGSAHLSEDDLGAAIVRINGNNIPNLYSNFTIVATNESGDNGEDDNGNGNETDNGNETTPAILTVPRSVEFGDTHDIEITRGSMPVPDIDIYVSRPKTGSIQYSTNQFGRVSISFDEVGTWDFMAFVNSERLEDETTCKRQTGAITIVGNTHYINQPVTIRAFSDASIDISGPQGYQSSGTVSGIDYTFTPGDPGQYSIQAESDEMEASKEFSVYENPSIQVWSSSGIQMLSSGESGNLHYIRLVGSSGQKIPVSTQFTMQRTNVAGGQPVSIPLSNSEGEWIPVESGGYTISFPGEGYYTEASVFFLVSGGEDSSSFSILNIDPILLGVILVIAAAFIWFFGRRLLAKLLESRDRKGSKKEVVD